MNLENKKYRPFGNKKTKTEMSSIISNMQTEALKAQIEHIAQKHYANLSNSRFKV